MNWKLWLHGLAAAFIGGAANAISNIAVAPETFNFEAGLKKLLMSALVSGVLGAALYLKKSPVPEDSNPNPPTA